MFAPSACRLSKSLMFALALPAAHAACMLRLSCWLQTYHTAADRLQLIPVTAKYAGGVQFEIQLDRAGATASDIINADLKVTLPSFPAPSCNCCCCHCHVC